MSSSIIMFLGIPLILINGYTNGQLKDLWDIIANATTTAPTAQEKNSMLLLAGEILFLFILATFANTNKMFSNFAVVVLAALWVVWFMKNPVQLSSIATALSGNQAQTNQPNIPVFPQQNFGLPFTAQNNVSLFNTLNKKTKGA